MSEDPVSGTDELKRYVLAAMRTAGFRSPTALARKADLSPSVVLRLVQGSVAPSVPTLQRLAPLLGVPEEELIRRAYPDGSPRDPGAPPPREIHLIAVKPAFTLDPKLAQTVVVTDQALRLSWLCTSGMFETKHMLELAEAVEAVMRLRMPFNAPIPQEVADAIARLTPTE